MKRGRRKGCRTLNILTSITRWIMFDIWKPEQSIGRDWVWRLLLLPRGLRMLMVLTCYRSLLYNLRQTGSDLYKFVKSQSKPYAVHNTPKPICTLALNSSQTCEIFLPRACDLAWSESVRVVSEGDCMFLTCSAQAAWAHQHGCWERDEGSEAEQYRDVGLCLLLYYRVYCARRRGIWRKNGVGGRGGAVHASIPLRDKSARPAKEKTGRACTKTRGRERNVSETESKYKSVEGVKGWNPLIRKHN